ncbi:TetR/AcrR family transcriptional regulator [Dactylosporangium sucinum]|uniref:TetR family transcriptional regulator n=1 Tax=Dactylosporangium sucinum TaxID=1424081 RepID=A0A917T7E9_9ACTN|nr:TetR/AcrR family transcriptional regulator [Dactylosporangium sucinum]GGM13402.1 TetR family transcriptional regulator [Dactylosporangium sucinum]
MGNREKLLDGALQCLFEKGYAETTARDIATTAGVSLAAIGYHFGTTQALLSTVLFQAMEQWADELENALNDEGDAALAPADRFVAIWTRVIDSIAANRALWTTQFEAATQVARGQGPDWDWTEAQGGAQAGLAELFHGIDGDEEPELARTVGGVYQALISGVVLQHLVTPELALSGRDLIDGLRAIAARLDP